MARRASRRLPAAGIPMTRTAPKILFAAAEVFPLVKIGGLADASGSLCHTLRELGLDIRIVLPGYRSVLERVRGSGYVGKLRGFGAPGAVRVLRTTLPDTSVPVYLIDAPSLFDRAGTAYQDATGHDWPDNAQRFGLYCRAVEQMCLGAAGLDWSPDVVHCNDWHTGLVPALLSRQAAPPPSLFTIHNLAYQGNFSRETFQALDLPVELWMPDGLEFHGMLSFIKGGLAYADGLTTVSPTHAREITTPGHGFGLDGLLRHRRGVLTGILNGADYRTWDPRHDHLIPQNYWTNRLRGKAECKQILQSETGLRQDADAIVLAHVARLTDQKGVDLILATLPKLLARRNVQLVVLGSGDARLQQAVLDAASAHPGRVAARIGHDETLAHRIMAGADVLLMPSRFEPCGLTQLYALRYGTVPVVHRTGGLADTIVNASEGALADGTATGFHCTRAGPVEFLAAVRRAIALHRASPDLWRRIMCTGMREDFGWAKSAARYADLYAELIRTQRTGGSADFSSAGH